MAAEQRALSSPFGAASYADASSYASAFQPGSLHGAAAAGIPGGACVPFCSFSGRQCCLPS